MWMRKILLDFGVECEDPFQLWCYNKSCIAIAKNPALHGRTNNLDVKLHYVPNFVAKREVNISYCSTDMQVVDIFTKCLSVQK